MPSENISATKKKLITVYTIFSVNLPRILFFCSSLPLFFFILSLPLFSLLCPLSNFVFPSSSLLFYFYLSLHLTLHFFLFSTIIPLIFPTLAPDDYSNISLSSITFPSNSRLNAIMCTDISIRDDDRFEEDAEKFSIQLTTTDSLITVVPGSGNVEIRDNESK